MLSMQTKNQLLFTLISQNNGYHLRAKKEKTKLLDKYCHITGQNRKAVIRKIRSGHYVKSMRKEKVEERRQRTMKYGNDVTAALIRLWEIFDRPCGQRLKPMLKTEVERLKKLGEIDVSAEMIEKLKTISERSIDAKLAPHKKKERLNKKYRHATHPLLYQKIPVKLSHEQDRNVGDTIQIDLVEHCGQAPKGRFINTLSTTDIGSGWWEGKAIFGKESKEVLHALYATEKQYPFHWGEIHPDNGSEFINETVYAFAQKQDMKFSRSRPYGKNDNCFVEQKNSTHVRKMVGHQRYDTKQELDSLNELYRLLSFYKNFFQPVIPLRSKERIGGHLKRTYGIPQTPYQNVLVSSTVSTWKKRQLTELYSALNPAELKRQIKKQQDQLYKLKQAKEQEMAHIAQIEKEFTNQQNFNQFSVANLIAESKRFRLHS